MLQSKRESDFSPVWKVIGVFKVMAEWLDASNERTVRLILHFQAKDRCLERESECSTYSWL